MTEYNTCDKQMPEGMVTVQPAKTQQISDCCELLGVASWNEKGFWQVDVFNLAESDEQPIWFCTGKIGEESNAAAEKAFTKFGKDLNVILGYYGECDECGDEKLLPEEKCDECGGQVNSYA